MIYLLQNSIASEIINDVPVLTRDDINNNDSLDVCWNVYLFKLKSIVNKYTIVNAIKLYSGKKFYTTIDQYNNILVHGDLTHDEYEHINRSLFNEAFKHIMRKHSKLRFVYNIDQYNNITMLYATTNTTLYLPTDLDLIFSKVLNTVSMRIASSHHIMLHDLFTKALVENHNGYIIATTNKFLAKLSIKPVQTEQTSKEEIASSEKTDRNKILEIITQDIGFTNLSLATESEVDDLIEYYKNDKQHKNVISDYDIRYMRLAREFSTWSKDPSTRLGAVAISEENRIVLSQGYNGFPRGIKDDHRLYIRELKYQHIVHAEMNVVYNAYENGISLKGSTLYVYGLPVCLDCANALIQVKIKRVVICDIKNDGRWNKSFEVTLNKFKEVGIIVDFVKLEDLD